MTGATPPLPPDVTAQQQMTPQMRALASMGQSGPSPQAAQEFNASSFVLDSLGQVASILKDVAEVLVTTKPAMMPALQIMLKAGSQLQNDIQASMPGQQPAPDAGTGPVGQGGGQPGTPGA